MKPILIILSILAIAPLAQEHGDVKCEKLCLPQDYPGKDPDEIGGVPTYSCQGTCKHAKEDPCAEGKEASSCGEWCRKSCCRCRALHCP
jgi:hypothetical protein